MKLTFTDKGTGKIEFSAKEAEELFKAIASLPLYDKPDQIVIDLAKQFALITKQAMREPTEIEPLDSREI